MGMYVGELKIEGSLVTGVSPQPVFRAEQKDIDCWEDGSLREEEKLGYGIGCGRRMLPYKAQDRYNRGNEMQTLKTIVLENAYLKATFLPTYGGKLWSLYDKQAERELLFCNPVFRPANLAIRNAWTAGGIEWNLGHTGHFAFTCEPVYCAKVIGEDGEEFLRMYEYEAVHGQIWQLDVHLPEDAKQLGVHVRIENSGEEAPLYWWTNTAVPMTNDSRVFSGTKEIMYQLPPTQGKGPGFGHCQMPYQPTTPGVDISYPARIPYSVEYFFQNSQVDAAPWEVCVEKNGLGFMERSTQPLYTRKMFCWGDSQGGKHWCDYLSEPGMGDYVEIQAGLAPTQLHTAKIGKYGVVSFSQFFAPYEGYGQETTDDWNEAREKIAGKVEETIGAKTVGDLHTTYEKLATKSAQSILHTASVYGSLEVARRKKEGEPVMAGHLLFEEPKAGDLFMVWQNILEGVEAKEVGEFLPSLTDERWIPYLEAYTQKYPNQSAVRLQLAISLAENARENEARKLLDDLTREEGNIWAWSTWGALEARKGAWRESFTYYQKAYEQEQGTVDCSFAEGVMEACIQLKEYEQAWNFFSQIPKEKQTEVEQILAAEAAVRVGEWGFLEDAFEKEFAAIREGAPGLGKVWQIYQAKQKAIREGVEFSEDMVDLTLPIPQHLDYRMSEKRAD